MPDASSTDTLTVNVKELLKFFDEKDDANKGDATGIVAMVGEDLNTAIFQHYAAARGDHFEVVQKLDKSGNPTGPHPVTPGGKYGPWLDRWLEVKPHQGRRFLYQTEIKGWAAAAIGGEILSVEASCAEVADYKQRRWEARWDSKHQTLNFHATAKVLVRMKPPKDLDALDVWPLLIFWEPIGPKELADDHLFCIPVTYNFPTELQRDWPHTWKENLENTKRNPFDRLSVFSVSSYLRSLPDDHIDLPMPEATHRLRTLNRLFSLGG